MASSHTATGPERDGDPVDDHDPVPLRPGGPCPDCGDAVLELDFLTLPGIAIKREMYDVCVIDTDDLPTPWRHPTVVVYHEDPDPLGERASTPWPTVD